MLLEVIRTELRNVKEEFGDARRSEIRASEEDLDILDLIAPEDVVVTLSHAGYAKRQPVSAYRAQRRGGTGRSATAIKEEDFVERLWVVNTHDTLLTFTSAGRVFWRQGVPAARRRPECARPADRQLDPAGSRREGAGGAAGARVHRRIATCSSPPATARSRRRR